MWTIQLGSVFDASLAKSTGAGRGDISGGVGYVKPVFRRAVALN